jgi:hypothetical protein
MRTIIKLGIVSVFLLGGCGGTWDKMPPPNISGPGSLKGVESFIAENGWEMQPKGEGVHPEAGNWKPVRGLPWKNLKDHEFLAVTQDGILYVASNPGWHHDWGGVAYNPEKKRFSRSIVGFKPIGGHWYVWAIPEFPDIKLAREYEK